MCLLQSWSTADTMYVDMTCDTMYDVTLRIMVFYCLLQRSKIFLGLGLEFFLPWTLTPKSYSEDG